MGPSNNWCIDTNVLKRKRRQQLYSKHGQNCQSVSVVHVIKWKMSLNFKDETLASTTCLFHALLLNCYLESPLQCSLCDHAKMFLTSEFSDLLFRKLNHKTQRGDCKQVGTTNSKPPGLIIMIGQSKTGSRNQIILFSSRCRALLRFLPASAKNWSNMQEKNYFPEPNRHMLTLFHPILMWRVTYWAPVQMLLVLVTLHQANLLNQKKELV
jgi:hypothetical protein